MMLFISALTFWLALFEALARSRGLRGVSWGVPGLGPALPLAALLSLRRVGRPGPGAVIIGALALPLALLLHIGLATVRNWRLNPLDQLRPGAYSDRTIERLDLPGPHGTIPALLITPQAATERAICVVHGSGCDKTFYAWRLVDALVARSLAVLLIDLDGHGESPRPQAYPEIVGSVTGAVGWLRERFARVGVLAMSLGGAVAAQAVAEGLAVDALVIEESPPQLRLDMAGYRRVRRQEAVRLLNPALLHLLADGSPLNVARAWRTTGIRATIGTWDLFDALDLLGSLGRIREQPAGQRPPTMLIYAANDMIVPTAQMERVRAAAAGWACFELLRGASHLSLPIDMRAIGLAADWFSEQL
jgi:pimeloyl-ACP methyl ester carboxylesterase